MPVEKTISNRNYKGINIDCEKPSHKLLNHVAATLSI